MDDDATPMFPLGTVLFPDQPLPLQVFEPRYLELVRTCLAGRPEFGVVLIERGSEVGGHDTRTDAGTVARVVEATELADGRWLLMTLGTRRVRVRRWLADDPHPWAILEDWPDEPPATAIGERLDRAAAAVRQVLALATEMGRDTPSSTFELPESPIAASYTLSTLAPLGPLDRHRLLCAASVEDRLAQLVDACREVRAVLEHHLGG